ncbi:MAG: amidase family protein, partial [Pseudomonadota bacterium]
DRGRFYGKAQNLNRALSAAYDAALEELDLLLLPTSPMAATRLPPADAPREEVVARAFEMIANTSPTCATGHPALSLPAGRTADGRPIGAMLVGPRLGERVIYRAAAALERLLAPLNRR